MSSPANTPSALDPFGIFTSLGEWDRLISAAKELRSIDQERMETMLEAYASGPTPLSPEAAVKVRSLAKLMMALNLDPEAIRNSKPQVMRELEVACVGCSKRDRCTRELWSGSAASTYAGFCPNASRLDQLTRV